MYKKFLNAILFGALILGSAGTITSCKDYDDEIDEINQKLNTMTQKDELNAQVASLTSAISAAQSGAAQAATEAANALAAAKEAAGVSDQALAAAAQAGGQSGEALTAAKNAASAAETAAANTKKAADAAAAAAADAVKAAEAGAGSAAAADKASEAAGKAQAAAAEAGKTAAAAEAAAATASEKAADAAEKAEAAANEAGVSAKEAAAAKTAAAAAEAKAAEAAAQAAVAKQAEAAAQKAAADALKAAADAADAAKKAADAETLAKAANEASAKAGEAAEAANKLAGEAKEAAGKANTLADSALTAANKAQGAAEKAQETADAAKGLAEAAKTVADAAAKQSALTELEGRVDGIEERLQKVEDNVDSLDLKTIADMVQKASDDLKALDLIASAVTSVSIVDSYTAASVLSDQSIMVKAQQGTWANFYYELLAAKTYTDMLALNQEWSPVIVNDDPLDLDFTTIVEYNDWTAAQGWGKWMDEYSNEKPFDFYGIGADLKNAMAFKKGHQVNRPDYFVVRVSPTNAVITGDMLQLVNSNGVNLNEYLTLSVDKFEGTLSRITGIANTRADETSATGLWIVKAELKSPYDAEKFAELTTFLTDFNMPQNPNQGSLRAATTRSTVNLDDAEKPAEETEADAQLINKILYAVQVNNTNVEGGVSDRFVTSSYDLTLGTSVFQPANRLHFTVNGKRVETLNNRFSEESKSFYEGSAIEQEYEERTWLPDTVDVKPGIVLAATKDVKQNAAFTEDVEDVVNTTYGVGYKDYDDRSAMDYMTVAPGEKFTVSLEDNQGWATMYDKYGEPTQYVTVNPVPTNYAVKAMYVVLDQPNAVESIPSEWNAWMTYDYTGINEIVEGTSIDITVDGDEIVSKNGDIIGFRVYAINWDGTLVDPDGRAFYIKVANSAEQGDAIPTVITPISESEFDGLEVVSGNVPEGWPVSDVKEFSLKPNTLKKGNLISWTPQSIKYTLAEGKEEGQYVEDGETASGAFFPIFLDKDGKEVFNMAMQEGDASGKTGFTKETFEKVVSVVTAPTIPNWLAYVDDVTYTGKLEITNEYGDVIETKIITFTKKLPTEAPKGYSPKTAQIVDGVLQLYVTPDNWTADAAKVGQMELKQVFNFGDETDVRLYPENYQFTFAASQKVDGKDADIVLTGDETLEVAKAYIDSKTKHATKVDYNFGKISTKLYDAKADKYADYVLPVDSFDTVYDCIYHAGTYSWHWMTLADYQAIEEVADDGTVTYPNAKATQADLDALYTNTVKYGVDGEQEVSIEYILGVSTKDIRYNAPLSEPYEGSLAIDEEKGARLISNANKLPEYFTVEVSGNTLTFTQLSDAPNPNADVPSTLEINYKDSYGHSVVVKVPMVVKARLK